MGFYISDLWSEISLAICTCHLHNNLAALAGLIAWKKLLLRRQRHVQREGTLAIRCGKLGEALLIRGLLSAWLLVLQDILRSR